MIIVIDNEQKSIEVTKVKIEIGECTFRLSLNNFGELILQKQNYGEGESAIIIRPNVSNEVRIG